MISFKKLYHIIFLFLCISHIELTATQKKSKPSMEEVFKRSREYYQAHPDKPRIDEEPSHWGQELMLKQKPPILALGERPPEIQSAIEKEFSRLFDHKANSWGRFRGTHGFYGIMNLAEEKLLNKLAFQDTGKNDVYILDVGCGAGHWGEQVVEYINRECKESTKNFYIFSVTAGQEQDNSTITLGNVTHYRYNHFNAENILQEFLKQEIDLSGKFDLIVSSWALQHMIDPIGTINQLYTLLSPYGGMLLATGFFFGYKDEPEINTTINLIDIFATSSIPALFKAGSMREHDHFLLFKTNEQNLEIPLSYNKVQCLPSGYDCSGKITCFEKSPTIQQQKIKQLNFYRADQDNYYFGTFYYSENNTQAGKLLEQLIKENLFYYPIRIEEIE